MEARPRSPSIDEIRERVERIFPGSHQEPDVQLTSDDVILASGPKCGTTWVQQILHGLRSGGSMDYEDINAAVPMLEFDGTSGGTEDSLQQEFPPNMFKAHLMEDTCPKGAGKFVIVTRNPDDAALSLYHYLCNWIFKDGELSMDEFVDWFYVRPYPRNIMFLNAHQMQHLASWYPRRHDENVLWIHYEDLKADLTECIRMISEFLQLGVGNSELLDLVERQASLEFMKQHATKFDARNQKLVRNVPAGLPRDAGLISHNYAGKVRLGKINESKEVFSTSALNQLKQTWDKIVKPVTGFDNYEELRSSINNELDRNFKN